MTAQGMHVFEIKRNKRAETLQNLLSIPFDIHNKDLITALNSYMNDFEYSTNQMYVYQALNESLKLCGSVWVAGTILPLPEFAKSFLTTFLYLGVAGRILENFSLTDFHEQLVDMKSIYNWCLKDNKEQYNPQIDTIEKLVQPEIQSLIKMLAPLCSVDFMLAWPRQTAKVEESSPGWSTYFINSAFSLVAQKPKIDLGQINQLKIAVEERSLDVGAIKGFQQAVNYFVTSPNFKEILSAQLSYPVEKAKEYLPFAMGGDIRVKML